MPEHAERVRRNYPDGCPPFRAVALPLWSVRVRTRSGAHAVYHVRARDQREAAWHAHQQGIAGDTIESVERVPAPTSCGNRRLMEQIAAARGRIAKRIADAREGW